MAEDFEELEKRLKKQEATYEDDPDELPATDALEEALGINPDDLFLDNNEGETNMVGKKVNRKAMKDAGALALGELQKLKKKTKNREELKSILLDADDENSDWIKFVGKGEEK